jgi:hypothetical protein
LTCRTLNMKAMRRHLGNSFTCRFLPFSHPIVELEPILVFNVCAGHSIRACELLLIRNHIWRDKKPTSFPRLGLRCMDSRQGWIRKKAIRDFRKSCHESVFAKEKKLIYGNILSLKIRLEYYPIFSSLLISAKMIQKMGSTSVLQDWDVQSVRRNYSPLARVPTNSSSGNMFNGAYLLPLRHRRTNSGSVEAQSHIWAPSRTSSRIWLSTHTRVQASWLGARQRMHFTVYSRYSVDLASIQKPIFTCVTGIPSSYVGIVNLNGKSISTHMIFCLGSHPSLQCSHIACKSHHQSLMNREILDT